MTRLGVGAGRFLDDDFVGTRSGHQDSFGVVFDVKPIGPRAWVVLEQAMLGAGVALAVPKPARTTRLWRVTASASTLALTPVLLAEIDTDASGLASGTDDCFAACVCVLDADRLLVVVGGAGFNLSSVALEQVGCAVFTLSTATLGPWAVFNQAQTRVAGVRNQLSFYNMKADRTDASRAVIAIMGLTFNGLSTSPHQWVYGVDASGPTPVVTNIDNELLDGRQPYLDVARFDDDSALVWIATTSTSFALAIDATPGAATFGGSDSTGAVQEPKIVSLDRQGDDLWLFDSGVTYPGPENNLGAVRRVVRSAFGPFMPPDTAAGPEIKPSDFGPVASSVQAASTGAVGVGVTSGYVVRPVGYLTGSRAASGLWFDGFDLATTGPSTDVHATVPGPVPPSGLDLSDTHTGPFGTPRWELSGPVARGGVGTDVVVAVLRHDANDADTGDRWARLWLVACGVSSSGGWSVGHIPITAA